MVGWAKGEMAGTSGLAKRVEAMQVVLVKKGGIAPGTTERASVVNKKLNKKIRDKKGRLKNLSFLFYQSIQEKLPVTGSLMLYFE